MVQLQISCTNYEDSRQKSRSPFSTQEDTNSVSHLLLFCIMRLVFPAVTCPHLITSSLRDVGPFHYNESIDICGIKNPTRQQSLRIRAETQKQKSDMYCQSAINKAVFSTESEVLSLIKDQFHARSSFCEVKVHLDSLCIPSWGSCHCPSYVSSLQLVRINEFTPSYTVSLMFMFILSSNFPTFLLSAPFLYQSFSILNFCMIFHLFYGDYLFLTFYVPLFHHIHKSWWRVTIYEDLLQ